MVQVVLPVLLPSGLSNTTSRTCSQYSVLVCQVFLITGNSCIYGVGFCISMFSPQKLYKSISTRFTFLIKVYKS